MEATKNPRVRVASVRMTLTEFAKLNAAAKKRGIPYGELVRRRIRAVIG